MHYRAWLMKLNAVIVLFKKENRFCSSLNSALEGPEFFQLVAGLEKSSPQNQKQACEVRAL